MRAGGRAVGGWQRVDAGCRRGGHCTRGMGDRLGQGKAAGGSRGQQGGGSQNGGAKGAEGGGATAALQTRTAAACNPPTTPCVVVPHARLEPQ